MQNMSFLRSKREQKRDFSDADIFSKSDIEKFLIQNVTRCTFFNPKSDALWKFCFKLRRVVFVLF